MDEDDKHKKDKKDHKDHKDENNDKDKKDKNDYDDEDNKMVGDHAAIKTSHTIDYKNMSDEELDEELRRLIKS